MTPTLWYELGIFVAQGIVFMTLTIILDNLKFRLNDHQSLEVDDLSVKKSADLIKE